MIVSKALSVRKIISLTVNKNEPSEDDNLANFLII